jgi:phosphatidylglycerophosphate synthase
MNGKVPVRWENPYDAFLYRLSEGLLPALRATHHTPNTITTYSFLCCLLARWCLWKDRVADFVLLNQLAYFLDCVDGHLARSCGMVSAVGDLYDHATDVVGDVLLFAIVWKKYGEVTPWWCVLVVSLFAALLCVALGCQQQRAAGSGGGPELLDYTIPLCPSSPCAIRWTRFFGSGTWSLVTTGLVVYLAMRKERDLPTTTASIGARRGSSFDPPLSDRFSS